MSTKIKTSNPLSLKNKVKKIKNLTNKKKQKIKFIKTVELKKQENKENTKDQENDIEEIDQQNDIEEMDQDNNIEENDIEENNIEEIDQENNIEENNIEEIDQENNIEEINLKNSTNSTDKSNNSQILKCLFRPFFALGFFCDQVPFVLGYTRKNIYVITSTASFFQKFSLPKLARKFVSNELPSPITSLCYYNNLIFAAYDNSIFSQGSNQINFKTFTEHKNDIIILFLMGSTLISIDKKSKLICWQTLGNDLILKKITKVNLRNGTAKRDVDRVVAACHPATYVNKIIVATQIGQLMLWNIRTNTLLYTFKGWNCSITCLESSTAIDVIAIGLLDGRIILHNIKTDSTITIFQDTAGSITCLSFCSTWLPILASSNDKGQIVFWNLKSRSLIDVLPNAHLESIAKIEFLQNQNILISSSKDNSIKTWHIETSVQQNQTIDEIISLKIRLLESKAGHAQPPTFAKFAFENKIYSTSKGDRTLREFYIYKTNSIEFSQFLKKKNRAAIKLHLDTDSSRCPPITEFDFCPPNNVGWDNFVSCHTKSDCISSSMLSHLQTWDSKSKKLGKFKLFPTYAKSKEQNFTCVVMSTCGNSCFAGTDLGKIFKYNIQSGILRAETKYKYSHEKEIAGIRVNLLTTIVISGSHDGFLKFWDANNLDLLDSIYFNGPISLVKLFIDNSMIAIVVSSRIVHIIDGNLKTVIRKFAISSESVQDIIFTPDCKYLIIATTDAVIRTYDIAAGFFVSIFKTDEPVTSMSFSPSSEFLLTTHKNRKGLYLWVNEAHFLNINLNPVFDNDFNKKKKIELPANVAELQTSIENERPEENKNDNDNDNDNESNDNESNKEIKKKSIDNIELKSDNQKIYNNIPIELVKENEKSNLITFSTAPRPQWLTLYNLEYLMQKNKIFEKQKERKTAPFFLTTQPGFEPKFLIANQKINTEELNIEKNLNLVNNNNVPSLITIIKESIKKGNVKTIEDFLATTSPIYLEQQIKSIVIDINSKETNEEAIIFLKFIKSQLENNNNFELIQSLLASFLRNHIENILKRKDLINLIEQISKIHNENWTRLESTIMETLCLINYFIGIQ
eukprot:TRINITY_DN361_c1_g1_i1.p1 TRINITY_DN361_c1_g1~~TRINITY_DN361_c1_g1_i1.p1  ORF type:complete len:1082 (+),score=400.70 TRINITY_DN361_c1_g1_i1:171-3416(+)